MKTKFTICLLLVAIVSFSQSFEKLKIETRQIYDANYNMDFDAIAKLSYPKIIELLGGKLKFIEKLDSDYLNDGFRMRLQLENPVFSYSEIRKVEDKTFYIVSYYNPVRYFFETKLDADAGMKKAAQLKESTNAKTVIFEPKRNSFNVKRNSKFVAISDQTTNGEWRFFNMDDVQQRTLFYTLFSTNVKKELGL